MRILRVFKIKYRLLTIFLMVSIIPIILVGIYSNNIYEKSINDKLSSSTYQSLLQINSNLIGEIKKYQYLSGAISVNELIQKKLNNYQISSDTDKSQVYREVDNIIDSHLIYTPRVKNIRIVNAHKSTFYEIGYDNITARQLDNIISNIEQQAPFDSWSYVKTFSSSDMIVVGNRIVNMYDYESVLGYMLIFLDEGIFSYDLLDNVNLGSGSSITLINTDGTVLSSNNNEIALGVAYSDQDFVKQLEINKEKNKYMFNCIINKQKYMVSYVFIKELSCYLVAQIPYSYIYSETRESKQNLGAFIGIAIFISIVLIILLYSSIMHPIDKIIANCKKTATGDFTAMNNDSTTDEISILSNNIDEMVIKIQDLLEQQKLEQIRKRKLELQMLQYQINPHFLFNTLNTLKWIAVINKVSVVSDGIGALSELLKSTILNGDEMVTIKDELTNLKNYFDIQKIRYADCFEVTYELDERLLQNNIPKFILQPIAENSIIHGMDNLCLHITISCYSIDDKNIAIDITDNGKGFDQKNVNKNKNKKMTAIGISNVDERLKITFGAAYGLQIMSTMGEGTTTVIKIPKDFHGGGDTSEDV